MCRQVHVFFKSHCHSPPIEGVSCPLWWVDHPLKQGRPNYHLPNPCSPPLHLPHLLHHPHPSQSHCLHSERGGHVITTIPKCTTTRGEQVSAQHVALQQGWERLQSNYFNPNTKPANCLSQPKSDGRI